MTARQLIEQFMLSLCIYREARGESRRGKELVADVIKNRVMDHRWPDTYTGVITQKLQFSSFNRNDPNAAVWPNESGDTAWEECVDVAVKCLSMATSSTQANHYHAVGTNPPWADNMKVTDTEGHHIFYKL